MLFHIVYIYCSIQIKLDAEKRQTLDFVLGEDCSDLSIKVYNLTKNDNILYKFTKDGKYDTETDATPDELDTLQEVGRVISQEFTEHGTYTLVLVNVDDEPCSLTIYSRSNKIIADEDGDVKNLKKIFADIETKLVNLYNGNLGLKSLQEKNILEAKRIIRGLYIMFIIPVIYFLVGVAKIKAVKLMFAPKKGLKP